MIQNRGCVLAQRLARLHGLSALSWACLPGPGWASVACSPELTQSALTGVERPAWLGVALLVLWVVLRRWR